MVYKVPSTMVWGYCTLFPLKMVNGQGVVCPLTVVHGAWTRVSSWVGEVGEVLFCLNYFNSI